MVAQHGSSGLFSGKHSYFDSPEKPVSPQSKRARISIEEVSPVEATADPDADTVYNTDFEASNEFPPVDPSPTSKASSPSLAQPDELPKWSSPRVEIDQNTDLSLLSNTPQI